MWIIFVSEHPPLFNCSYILYVGGVDNIELEDFFSLSVRGGLLEGAAVAVLHR